MVNLMHHGRFIAIVSHASRLFCGNIGPLTDQRDEHTCFINDVSYLVKWIVEIILICNSSIKREG